MSEIRIRVRVNLGKSLLRGTFLALAFGVIVPEIGSENVTLTTYYPAPSGVFTRVISTDNSYLARDGGNVIIGGSGAAPAAKLDVRGTIYAGNSDLYFTNTGHAYAATGAGLASIQNDNGSATLLIEGRSVGGARQVKINTGVGDLTTVTGNLTINSDLVGSGALVATSAACVGPVAWAGSAPATCGGNYPTFVSGVVGHWNSLALTLGTMIMCCPCPACSWGVGF